MSVGIREIDITYGLNLAAAGFRKICAEDGTPRPLYCSSEESSDSSNPSNCSYLWVNYNGNADTGFITDLYIIYGDELSPPEGYQVLKKNIYRGSSFKAYLCFKRQPSSSHTGCKLILTALI